MNCSFDKLLFDWGVLYLSFIASFSSHYIMWRINQQLIKLWFKLFLELFVLMSHRRHLWMKVLRTLKNIPVVGHKSLGLVPFITSVKATIREEWTSQTSLTGRKHWTLELWKRDTPLNTLRLIMLAIWFNPKYIGVTSLVRSIIAWPCHVRCTALFVLVTFKINGFQKFDLQQARVFGK